jgi:hypothetical protein
MLHSLLFVVPFFLKKKKKNENSKSKVDCDYILFISCKEEFLIREKTAIIYYFSYYRPLDHCFSWKYQNPFNTPRCLFLL